MRHARFINLPRIKQKYLVLGLKSKKSRGFLPASPVSALTLAAAKRIAENGMTSGRFYQTFVMKKTGYALKP